MYKQATAASQVLRAQHELRDGAFWGVPSTLLLQLLHSISTCLLIALPGLHFNSECQALGSFIANPPSLQLYAGG